MWIGRVRAGAAWMRRLRATCATALTLFVAGLVPLGQERAEAAGRGAPLAYHATVINGTITGSSFQIADGVVLTNAHVVGSARPGAAMVLVIDDGRAGIRAQARVVAVSRRMDIAVLAMPRGLMPVVARSDAPLEPGRRVRAAGVVAQATGPGPRMELDGRISSRILTLPPYGPGLIAEMPGIRRGFSGGPVFDREGRLVGMVAALRPDPDTTRSATGEPLAGQEAFVLSAAAIRAEAVRLIADAGAR